jgi:cytochrome b561
MIRFGIKQFSKHPLPSNNQKALNRLAKAVHKVIYGIVFAVVVSGIACKLIS